MIFASFIAISPSLIGVATGRYLIMFASFLIFGAKIIADIIKQRNRQLTKSKVGVVIPCYIGGDVTIQMVSQVIKYADLVVVVDDCCPLNTGNKLLKEH